MGMVKMLLGLRLGCFSVVSATLRWNFLDSDDGRAVLDS